jgi:hypothetical protein
MVAVAREPRTPLEKKAAGALALVLGRGQPRLLRAFHYSAVMQTLSWVRLLAGRIDV